MSFYLPSDPDFEEALRIRRGEQKLDPALSPFIRSFAQHFDATPLAVMTDTIPVAGTRRKQPRLSVVLERSADLRAFTLADGFGFDSAKQAATARIWADTMSGGHLSRFGLPPDQSEVDWVQDLFVYFAEFEKTAEWAAHEAVKGDELTRFIASLDLGDRFWRTERFVGPPIVFVYTDEQAARLRSPEIRARWADLYYPLVKRHDEFGYLDRNEIHVAVDSKETFERDYSGNWYYYFK